MQPAGMNPGGSLSQTSSAESRRFNPPREKAAGGRACSEQEELWKRKIRCVDMESKSTLGPERLRTFPRKKTKRTNKKNLMKSEDRSVWTILE